MAWKEMYKQKLVSVEKAASVVKSGDRVWFGAVGSAPKDVLLALCKRYQELQDVRMVSGLVMFPYEFMKAEYKGHIGYTTLFMGPLERMFFNQGNIDVNSYQFAKSDWLMENWVKPDVCMLECSPPDEEGNMSFGMFPFNADVAVRSAKTVVIQVNQKTPYAYGTKAHINVKDADYICEQDHDIPELPNIPVTEIEKQIASHIVGMIDDGSTIQIGIGGLANAVGFFLESKKNLGIHTEMLTDSMVAMAKKGIINGSRKTLHPGKMACAFAAGTRETYDFMHKNDQLHMFPVSYILSAETIARNDHFISINNALTVDLTGQICSESLGFQQFSGTGGQVDLVRGAALSKGGKSFIALNSIAETKNGPVSRIATKLAPGTIVTTPRTDAHLIVTEFGIADVRNKSIPERVRALANIAHPQFRDGLLQEAKDGGLLN